MKLRWPEHVILLRSNHETIEVINTDNVASTSHQQHFAEVVKMTSFLNFASFCQKLCYQLLCFFT